MASKKWLVCHFPDDNTFVACDHKALFITGKLRFLSSSRVKLLYHDVWFEGQVIEEFGKWALTIESEPTKTEKSVSSRPKIGKIAFLDEKFVNFWPIFRYFWP